MCYEANQVGIIDSVLHEYLTICKFESHGGDVVGQGARHKNNYEGYKNADVPSRLGHKFHFLMSLKDSLIKIESLLLPCSPVQPVCRVLL